MVVNVTTSLGNLKTQLTLSSFIHQLLVLRPHKWRVRLDSICLCCTIARGAPVP